MHSRHGSEDAIDKEGAASRLFFQEKCDGCAPPPPFFFQYACMHASIGTDGGNPLIQVQSTPAHTVQAGPRKIYIYISHTNAAHNVWSQGE